MTNVKQPGPGMLDVELGPHDVQALSGADAIAAFLARLGSKKGLKSRKTP